MSLTKTWSRELTTSLQYSYHDHDDDEQDDIDNVIETTDFTSVNTPTFFAQKGRIEARRRQKDSALVAFNRALQNIHQGDDNLELDLKL